MRILIGFNGSDAATAALRDLHRAGFSDGTEALVFTVAEAWHVPKSDEGANSIAESGRLFLCREFPSWKVDAEIASGSPAREILARSETFSPDLIVVGEPQRVASAGNIFL